MRWPPQMCGGTRSASLAPGFSPGRQFHEMIFEPFSTVSCHSSTLRIPGGSRGAKTIRGCERVQNDGSLR